MLCVVPLCRHFAQLQTSFVLPARGQRGKRRRLARAAKRGSSVVAEVEAAKAPLEEEKQSEDSTASRVEVSSGGMRTVEGHFPGYTFGLNATTRALEAAVAFVDPSAPSSPYSLLVLTSSNPPSLTSHYVHFSHHLHLPLLTLHPSIPSTQLARAISPSLTSLLILALHTSPPSPLLALLLPFGRTLRIPWLEAALEQWRGLRVEAVARSEERAALEDKKRRKREEEERKARPLSPKSIAAAVWKEKERERERARKEAEAQQALSLPSPPAAAADITADDSSMLASVEGTG